MESLRARQRSCRTTRKTVAARRGSDSRTFFQVAENGLDFNVTYGPSCVLMRLVQMLVQLHREGLNQGLGPSYSGEGWLF